MYVKTNWQNDAIPAINAENLNNMETGIEDAHNSINDIQSEIEQINNLFGTVLFENADGVVGNLTLNDDVANYKKIDVIYSRDSWAFPTNSASFYKKEDNTFCCHLPLMYGYGNTNLFIGSATYDFSGKTGVPQLARNISVDITTSIARENFASIKIFKIIGYK